MAKAETVPTASLLSCLNLSSSMYGLGALAASQWTSGGGHPQNGGGTGQVEISHLHPSSGTTSISSD